MKLAANYVEKPWGRTVLPVPFKNHAGKIGEIWFDAENRDLPLLVKYLFTSEKLSIQVHPNDVEAKQRGARSGKEECWYILDAEPGATLGIGTKYEISAGHLRDAAMSGAIEQLIDWKPVKAGDYFYIPAGTVHAIGAGISLIEVQQNADITYRLYDYGRDRALHLDDGLAVSKARPYDDLRSGNVGTEDFCTLADSSLFRLMFTSGTGNQRMAFADVPYWIMPISGTYRCGAETLEAGECGYYEPELDLEFTEGARALIAQSKF